LSLKSVERYVTALIKENAYKAAWYPFMG
jgi:hypothetical protein